MVVFRECSNRFPTLRALETYWNRVDQDFPIRITRSWFERIQSPTDPLAKQVFPQPSELDGAKLPNQHQLLDPVGEQGKRLHPFVVQKHADRVLLLLSRHCHLHCRYCFRRTLPDAEEPTDEQLTEAIEIIQDLGVQEVILTGGDPLFVKDKRLQWVLNALESIPTVRVHTRAPITYPDRITPALCEIISGHPNVWVLIHCNHVLELSDPVIQGIQQIQRVGIPVLNQAVLLRGVNDDVDALVALFQRLVELQVFPYYLHHTDRVQGAADFFVSLEDGWVLYEAVEKRVSGIALPKYVIDLPDGSGKIPVERYLRSRQHKDDDKDKEKKP